MKVNLHVPKIEIVPVEVPDEMLTNILFDNCKANWDKRPQTAVTPDRNDYIALKNYIAKHYGYIFVDDFHLLTDRRVYTFLCMLANRLPANVHLI